MTNTTERVSGYLRTPKDTRDSSRLVKDMVKELITILMQMFSKVIGPMVRSMVMVFLMELKPFTKDNGKMACLMAKASINLMIPQNMKASFSMENLTVEASLITTFCVTKGSSNKACFTEKE